MIKLLSREPNYLFSCMYWSWYSYILFAYDNYLTWDAQVYVQFCEKVLSFHDEYLSEYVLSYNHNGLIEKFHKLYYNK